MPFTRPPIPDDPDGILTLLADVGGRMTDMTTERDEMAAFRRDLYVAGREHGLSHKRMAEAQGITEGAVTLALRKMPAASG